MIEKYINYGECEICHKKKPRLMMADICEDCLEDYIKAIEVWYNGNEEGWEEGTI